MALRTIAAKGTAMHILLGVAAETIFRQAGVAHMLLRVTGIAGGLGVLACQGKPGLFSVMETDTGPAIGAVAGFATRGEASLMAVLLRMAAGAAQFRILESR